MQTYKTKVKHMKAYRITYKEKTEHFESFRFAYYSDVNRAREVVIESAETIASYKGLQANVTFIESDGTHFVKVRDNAGNDISLEQTIRDYPLFITEINIQ